MSFEIKLSDESFQLDAASAERSIESFNAQIDDLVGKLDKSRVEFTKFVDLADKHSKEADAIEARMVTLMRSSKNTDEPAAEAAALRVKARAATQAAEQIRVEIQRTEVHLQQRQTAINQAERNRAGIELRAKAQQFARAIVELRPMVIELMDLATLAGTSLHAGRGLVPDFSVPEVAGLRFDLSTGVKR
jgi:chromosome segregation ATPase